MKDICTKIGSGATPRGGKDAYIDEGISLIRSQNILDFSFSHDGLTYINEEQARKLNGVTVEVDDVLLNITGDSVARVCIVDNDILPARVNQHVCILRGDKDKVLSSFILYFLQMKKQELLQMASGGATRNALTKGMIEELEIDLPSIEDQKKIVSTLDSIQEKLKTNNKINRNLWDQIDAWFYRLYTSDNAVRIMLGDVVTRCSEKVKDNVVKVLSPISTGEIVLSEDFFTKQVYSKDTGKYLKVNPFEYCYNPARANIGSIGMNDFDFTGCVSPVYVVFKTKDILRFYMSRYIRTDSFKAEVITRSSGSVRQALRYEDLVQIEFRKPSDYDLEEFNEFYLGLKMKIESIKKENARLHDLRDCMLPRLMSGELDVSDLDLL